MKKHILTAAVILSMVIGALGCANADTKESTEANTSKTETTTKAIDATEATTTTLEATTEASVNEREFKVGTYAGNASYTSGEFSMAWNFVVAFNGDGTFSLVNDAGEDKGAGTYALTDNCYTMTYSDGRTCTFTTQKDGTLKVVNELPYGQASIDPAMVGGIALSFKGEETQGSATEETTTASAEKETTVQTGSFTIAAGTYAASYTKESPMAGTVVYNYTAVIGADGTFSYAVKFDMAGNPYDGASANGTYVVDGSKFIFTDSEGNVTEGSLTANDTIVISLKASAMAKEPYEVTFIISK